MKAVDCYEPTRITNRLEVSGPDQDGDICLDHDTGEQWQGIWLNHTEALALMQTIRERLGLTEN